MKPFAVLLAGLALVGCTKAVEITDPSKTAQTTAPVTRFTVAFAKYFRPGSFHAELDGADVTGSFVPIAAPSKTATLVMPDAFAGFTGGTVTGAATPPQTYPVGTLPPDVHFTPATAPPSPPPSPGPGSSGPPEPNIAFFTHTLHVSGQCNGMICDTVDDLKFVPPHLYGLPTGFDLKVGQRLSAQVATYPAMKVDLTNVRIRPLTPSVSLDGQPAGAPIVLTIPAGGPSRPFSVTGVVSAGMVLIIEARGVQMGSIQGVVNN